MLKYVYSKSIVIGCVKIEGVASKLCNFEKGLFSGRSANPKARKLSCWMLLPTFPTVSQRFPLLHGLPSAAQAAFQVLSGPVGRWCQDHSGGPFGAAHAARWKSWRRPPVGGSLAQKTVDLLGRNPETPSTLPLPEWDCVKLCASIFLGGAMPAAMPWQHDGKN